MHVLELTQRNFTDTVQSPGIVLLDFWAPWCGPCRLFAPVYAAAAERHPDVRFAKLNTELEPAVAAAFRIRAIPTLIALRDGVRLFSHAGALPAQALDALVTQLRAVDMDALRGTPRVATTGEGNR